MPWVYTWFQRERHLGVTTHPRRDVTLIREILSHKGALRVAWQEQRLLAETDDTEVDIRNIYKQIAAELDMTEEILSEEIARFFSARIFISC
jgi:hypothetical protein